MLLKLSLSMACCHSAMVLYIIWNPKYTLMPENQKVVKETEASIWSHALVLKCEKENFKQRKPKLRWRNPSERPAAPGSERDKWVPPEGEIGPIRVLWVRKLWGGSAEHQEDTHNNERQDSRDDVATPRSCILSRVWPPLNNCTNHALYSQVHQATDI